MKLFFCATCISCQADKPIEKFEVKNSFGRCLDCSKSKIRYNIALLNSFCKVNKVTLTQDYEKVTRDTKISGYCISCKEIFEKDFRSLVIHGGPFCTICTTKRRIKKFEKTNMKNIGVKNPSQSAEVKKKKEGTNSKNRGVKHPSQSEEVKRKMEETNIRIRGVKHPSQSEEVKRKKEETNIRIRGVKHPFQSEEVKNKIRQTSIERYGVEHPMQNPRIAEKSSKNSYRTKEYKFLSNHTMFVQGYEPFALKELENQGYTENDLVTGSSNVPTILYTKEDGKERYHYPDIFIPSENRCIEVKSTWTLEKKQDSVYKKQEYALAQGFEYEIWVYDGKGTKEVIKI